VPRIAGEGLKDCRCAILAWGDVLTEGVIDVGLTALWCCKPGLCRDDRSTEGAEGAPTEEIPAA